MKLTKEQANKLKDVDIIKASHKAREEATHLLNDQGLTVLSLAVSKFLVDIAEAPDKLIKEFTH